MVIELDAALPLQNQWQRWHWRKRGRYLRELAKMIAFCAVLPASPYSAVGIRVLRRSNWRGIAPDWDAVCIKPLLDVLQPASKRHPYGLGVIADDSRDVICDMQVQVERGKAQTIIEITDLSWALDAQSEADNTRGLE